MKKTLSSLAAAAVFLSGLPGLSGAMSFSATAEETSASVVAAFSSAPSIILSESGAKTCSPGEILTFSAFISNEAVYNLSVTYINAVSEDTVLSLKIDGELPFAEADNLRFPTGWINGNPPAADRFGNETVPEQVMDSDPSTLCARDFAGASELPYLLTFAAGTHEITLTVRQGEWIPVTVSLTPPEQPEAYKVPESPPEIPAALIVIEGEDADKKTSKALIPLSDNASAAVHPSDPTLEKLNYIGGSNWQKSGETLVWNFTAETAGYYSLAASYRQNKILGGASYRHLKIDGETPFAEAQRIKFTYGYNWRCMNFTADGNNEKNAPYLIYLGAGPHTLSLSATAGEFSEIYAAMREITSALGDLYLDITTVTGETVDLYRSYNLFEQIPAFNDRIEENVRALATLTAKMEQIQNKKGGSQVSVLQSAAEILRQMRDHPYIAHRYKNAFYNAYTNLSAAMGGLADTPLDLDRIFLVGCGGTAPTVRPAFFTGVAFGAKRFLSSFFSDYSAVSDSEPDASLTIWVNWGRDQAKVLNTLIQDDFSAKQGVGVTVKVVNATLVQAILSGKGPDCILQTARSEPVNLAMRGALVDLSEFSDLEEVTGQFAKDASVPYQYKGGTYALPDTQNFYMMFIRNDIFSSFGLSPPETWEEFLETAAVLQRNNLQPSLPYTQITDSTIVNVGAGGLTLYPTLVLQNGLPLYSPDASQSTLTDAARIQIFSKWTEWYTKYKIPVVIDFYNRFRIGSAPIGIAPYTLYTQLKAAAPEIAGRWSVYPIPGTRREDGTVSRLSAGSGTGCAITQLSQNREEAWTFLKWWTSADTQIKYSDRLESLLGPLGRVAVSNTAAFEALGWEPETLIELRKQRGELAELPEVPGGYYLPRGIDQAFWNVTELNKIPADTLTEWGAVVDREIARKAREYN